MKDYEFLRHLVNTGRWDSLTWKRVHAIADQIEQLSREPKAPDITKRLCVMSCGHQRFYDNPSAGLFVACPICACAVQVVSIDAHVA